MRYFLPLLFLTIAVFSVFAIYKYHKLAFEKVDFLANTIDAIFVR